MNKQSSIRLDAYEKVTGKAVYTDDLTLEGMLWLKEVHCPLPHARILSIDTRAAEAMPGVACVLTAGDLPVENPRPFEKPVLAGKVVLCAEEAVALVAADTAEHAEAAARKVKAEYEPLPAVFTAAEAVLPGAPKVHPSGNIACDCVMEKGDVKEAFAGADVIVSETFHTQRMHHGAIEPDCMIAAPDGEGGLLLYGASKGPFNVRRETAGLLNLEENKVRVRHMTIGGGFGGKMCDSVILAARAGAAALHTGRPCKLLWTREETLTEGIKRHPFDVTYRIGAGADGRITAVEIHGLADAGAYLAHTKGVVFRAMAECVGPYVVPNVSVRLRGVYTNHVQSDAVRGFGTPQVAFGMEGTMDILAQKLGISPLELRKRNLLREHDLTAAGQAAEGVGISRCVEELEKVFDASLPPVRVKGMKAYGKGIALLFRGESHGALAGGKDLCGIDLDLNGDGTVLLSTSISEVGQGAHTAEAETLARLLKLPLERIRVRGADTLCTPMATTTSGSRGAISGSNAVLLAVEDLTGKMKPAAAKWMKTPSEAVVFSDGRFWDKDGGKSVSFDEAAKHCASYPLHAEGRFVAPPTFWDWEKHCGQPYYSYTYGLAAAEVEVDLVTGSVKLCDLVSLNDLGRIINYEEAKAQIAGGLMMSVGFALTEETGTKNGVILNRNFDRYLMPLAADMEHIRPMPMELVPAPNPTGVHGVGEASASIAAPAIANAVSNALGVRMTKLPMTLECVRVGINQMRKERER